MPTTKVRSKWTSGNLQFTDTSGNVIVEIDGPNRRVEPYTFQMVDDYVVNFGTSNDVKMLWNASYMEFAPGSGFWSTCPHLNYPDPTLAYHWFEDFTGHKSLPTTTGSGGGWKCHGDSDIDNTAVAGTTGGRVQIAPETGSNKELYYQLGEKGTETYIEYVKSSGKKSWVEFRIAYTSITNAANIFVGLAEEGCADSDFIVDTGDSFADKDLIGFVIWEGDPNAIDVNTRVSGTATEDVGVAGVPVANTFLTLGIYFDGAETVSYYKDGTAVQTSDLDDSSFPVNEELSPIIAMKNGAADAELQIDWIRMVSER